MRRISPKVPRSTFNSLVLFSLKHPIFVKILVKNHQIMKKKKTLLATAKYENLVSNTFTKKLDNLAAQNFFVVENFESANNTLLRST